MTGLFIFVHIIRNLFFGGQVSPHRQTSQSVAIFFKEIYWEHKFYLFVFFIKILKIKTSMKMGF